MNSTPLESLAGVTSARLIAEAMKIAADVRSWKKARTFGYEVPQCQEVAVDVYNASFNNDFWVARVNEFAEVSDRAGLYAALLKFSIGSTSRLDESHTEYEKHYIEELYDFNVHAYELPGAPDEWETYSYLVELFYRLQWPLKRRKFYNLVHIAKHRTSNAALVISVAVTPEVVPGAKSTRGLVDAQYTLVEFLDYDADKDKLEWIMTTCSDAKGNVPQWLARTSINGVVAKDVPHFMKWVAQKQK